MYGNGHGNQRGSQPYRINYERSDVPNFRRGNDNGGHYNQQRSYQQHYVGRSNVGGQRIGGNARQQGPRSHDQIIFRRNDRGGRSNQQHNRRRSHNVGHSNVGRSIGGKPTIRRDGDQIIVAGVGTFSSNDSNSKEIQRYYNIMNKKQRNIKPTPRDRGRFDNLSTAASSKTQEEIENERKRALEIHDTLAAKARPIKKRLPSNNIALWSAPGKEKQSTTNETNETTSSSATTSTSSTSSATSASAASETSVPSNDVGASASTATSTAAPLPSTTTSSSPPEESTAGLKSPPEDQQYQALKIVPYETAKKNLEQMVNIKSKMKKAETEDEKRYLKEVGELLRKFLLKFYYAHCKNHNIVPRRITWNDIGCYLIWNSGKKGQTLLPVPVRVMEQSSANGIESVNEIAALLATTLECRSIMSKPELKPFVEAIEGLNPPRLRLYKEMHEKKLDYTVQMFIEGGLAACTEGRTRSVFELFTELPSKEIKNIVSIPKNVDQRGVALLQRIDEFDVVCSWGQCRVLLEQLKTSPYLSEETRLFLATKLRDVPDDEFVKWHMTQRVFGYSSKLMGYTDAVPPEDDVRAAQLDKLVDDLLEVFNEDVMEYYEANGKLPDDVVKDISKLISTIDRQSGDYNHYKPCEKKALAGGAVAVLREKRSTINRRKMIVVEFTTTNAIKDVDPDEHRALFPEGSTFIHQHDTEDDIAATLVDTPAGVSYLIIYSFFNIVSEDRSLAVRIKTIRRLIATMTLLNKAGIVPDETLEEEVKVWQAFLMTWVGLGGWLDLDKLELSVLNGSFREARDNASGKGFFLTPATEGVISVAKRFGHGGIGALEALYFRTCLGMREFNGALSAFEVDIDAKTSSPIEIDSTCSSCEKTATCCPGADVKDWSLLYRFTCTGCVNTLHLHEIKHLIQLLRDGHALTDAQFERVRKSYERENERAEKHKSNNKNTQKNNDSNTSKRSYVRRELGEFKPSSICQACPDDLDEQEREYQLETLAELEVEKDKRKNDNQSKAWRQTYDEKEEKKHQEIIDSGRDYVKITCQVKECSHYVLMYKREYDNWKSKGHPLEKSCKMCARRLKKAVNKVIDGDIVGDKHWKVEVIQGRHQ